MTTKKLKPTKTGITPSDPGPDRNDWAAIAEDLKANPGQWFLIFENGLNSTVRAVKQGKCPAVRPNLGFRARTKNNVLGDGPRRCDLHMKWDPDLVDPLAETLHEAKGK